jgi:predicted transcriptional regulator YheO
MFKKIQGHSSLIKDTKTNAVINTDADALNNAKKVKERMMKAIEKEKSIDKRLEQIEELLKLMLEGTKKECPR